MHEKKTAKRISMEEVTLFNTGITMIQISGKEGGCYSMASFHLPHFTNLGVPIFVRNRIFSNIRKDMGANRHRIFVHTQCKDEYNCSACTLATIRVLPSTCTSKLNTTICSAVPYSTFQDCRKF
jgi:hypothetical protein